MAPPRTRQIQMIWAVAALAGVTLAVIAAWTLLALDEGARPADPGDAVLVASGAAVYAAQCGECHGERLEGAPDWRRRNQDGFLPAPPHDESGHTWHHADQQLFDMVKRGGAAAAPPGFASNMPGYDGVLADADIWAVLAFIKSSWPEDIRRRQATATRRWAAEN